MNSAERGFTLLEILAVVMIVGILAGVVVLTAFDRDQSRLIVADAERFMLTVELARREATVRNRNWSVYLDRDQYYFAEYDPEVDEWIPVDTLPFEVKKLAPSVIMVAMVDGHTQGEVGSGKEGSPDILIFPGGEQSLFAVDFSSTHEGKPVRVHSDGVQPTQITKLGVEDL